MPIAKLHDRRTSAAHSADTILDEKLNLNDLNYFPVNQNPGKSMNSVLTDLDSRNLLAQMRHSHGMCYDPKMNQ